MDVKTWIKRDENCELKPYKDTVGKTTIGWGRNIEDNGISQDEADYLFENDLRRSVRELSGYEWYHSQPDDVKSALINMNFNLGITRFLGFKKMIAALKIKDYRQAAIEALDSLWAKQVGNRARDIAIVIREADASTTRTDSTD